MADNNEARIKGILLRKIQNSANRRRVLRNASIYLNTKIRQLINVCLLLITSRGIAVTNKYKRSCRRLERNNGWVNLVWSTYSEQRVLDFFLIGLFLFPAIATNFFPKTGLAVPNTSSRAHLSVFSSSSNVEHLLQIGIVHFKQCILCLRNRSCTYRPW